MFDARLKSNQVYLKIKGYSTISLKFVNQSGYQDQALTPASPENKILSSDLNLKF